jgi:AcrR family transcriptional regulator
MKRQQGNRAVGRPRAFDEEKALEQAVAVFRRKGYEGTSLSELTEAMGINRPSLYAAFGDKEKLFRKVLDRYIASKLSFVEDAMKEKTAHAFVKRLLCHSAVAQTDCRGAPGCLTVHGALACREESRPIRKELIRRREELRHLICERLKRAKKEGELPASANPADLARYFTAVIQGMAVQASGGATRRDLERVAETALRAWPS